MTGLCAPVVCRFRMFCCGSNHIAICAFLSINTLCSFHFLCVALCIARMSLTIASRRLQCSLFRPLLCGTAFPAPLGERGKGREGVS